MKLYNTLTKSVETLTPQDPNKVTIYTCGPTVYDYPHVGNWFTFVRYDLLVRTLKAGGLTPLWVMNITDVGHLVSDADEGEDKLEKGAKREGKTAWDVAKFYTENFEQGLAKLNTLKPDFLPRATEHIAEQIELVQLLEEKGHTYRIDDGIYFDTKTFPDYSSFAKLDLDEQQAGARVEHNSQKHNASDFALWKFSPTDHKRDMEWDSPWGKGFPGWHLECSAMAKKYLGETLDIHSGGIDHIPVHHTNEVAQSQAAYGQPLANVWMHTNHITVNNEKISKSSGNGITLEDIEKKGLSPLALRLHVLESHYRSQSRFSWDSLVAAQNRLRSLQAMADMRFQANEQATPQDDGRIASMSKKLLECLQDDLNTPFFLRILSELVTAIENAGLHTSQLDEFIELLTALDAQLGLDLLSSEVISKEQRDMIEARESARAKRDWEEADRLRNELLGIELVVRDTAFGPIWSRL